MVGDGEDGGVGGGRVPSRQHGLPAGVSRPTKKKIVDCTSIHYASPHVGHSVDTHKSCSWDYCWLSVGPADELARPPRADTASSCRRACVFNDCPLSGGHNQPSMQQEDWSRTTTAVLGPHLGETLCCPTLTIRATRDNPTRFTQVLNASLMARRSAV